MPNNDYILRSDALKATCENCTEHYVCNGKCDDTDRLRKIPAADVEPKKKWIPVTERLPEKLRFVLVFSKFVKMETDCVSNDGNWYSTPGVTHWMPLPEPPKEKDHA